MGLGGGSGAKLARHGTAALLNAGAGLSGFPFTVTQVLTMVKAAWDSGNHEPTATLLENANDPTTGQDCPL